MSIGLSEGFTNVVATTNFTEYWTGFYMVLGQSMIVGGILLGIDVLVEEVENSYRITVPFFKRKDVIARSVGSWFRSSTTACGFS